MSELPDIIPVFPLPNVVLFPRVQLPLHVFEPRYRAMVRDTLQADPPLVGMALLRSDKRETGHERGQVYPGNPPIFPVGCAGKLVKSVPLADGRFNILLEGLCAYRVQEEFDDRSYRRARVEWLPAGGESLSTARRDTLGRLLRTYLQKEDAVRKLMADPDMTDELFVNFFAFHLDLPPLEKQTLLDADGLDARADALEDILEFKLSESQWPGGGGGGNDRVH